MSRIYRIQRLFLIGVFLLATFVVAVTVASSLHRPGAFSDLWTSRSMLAALEDREFHGVSSLDKWPAEVFGAVYRDDRLPSSLSISGHRLLSCDPDVPGGDCSVSFDYNGAKHYASEREDTYRTAAVSGYQIIRSTPNGSHFLVFLPYSDDPDCNAYSVSDKVFLVSRSAMIEIIERERLTSNLFTQALSDWKKGQSRVMQAQSVDLVQVDESVDRMN